MQTQHDRAKLLWKSLLAIRNHSRNLQAIIPNRWVQLYHLVTNNAGCRRQVSSLQKTTDSLWTTNNMHFCLQMQLSPGAPSDSPYNQVIPFTLFEGIQCILMTTGNEQIKISLRNRNCYIMGVLHNQQSSEALSVAGQNLVPTENHSKSHKLPCTLRCIKKG